MARCLVLLTATLFCLVFSGCRMSRPDWFRPGNLPYQQQRAVVHDPYADNDAGPEVVGARPREYEKPLAEPVRADLLRSWLNH